MTISKQNKSFLTLLALVVLAGGVVAFAYFGVFRADMKAQAAKDNASHAFQFHKKKVKTVALTAKGKTTIVERQGGGWKIVSPVMTLADTSSVNAIVDKLHDLEFKSVVAKNESKAKDFGLDQPQFEVKATLDSGRLLDLKVGMENAFDNSLYYVTNKDKRIFQAEDALKWPLDKTLFDLRDKRIITAQLADVEQFSVETNGSDWSVEHDGDQWKLTVPIQDQADKSVVESVINRIGYLQAKSFAAETAPADQAGLAKYGLDKPVAQVTYLIGHDRAKTTLDIGQVGPKGKEKTYARLVEGSPVWEIDGSILKALEKTPNDLRDKTIDAFKKADVAKLVIRPAKGQPLTILRTEVKKKGASFPTDEFTVNGQSKGLKEWKLSSALYTLSTLKGTSIVEEHAKDLSKYGLDKPRLSFTAFDKAGKQLAEILVGTENATSSYAMAAGSDRVYQVSKYTVDDLPKSMADVLEKPATKTLSAKSKS